MTFTQLDIAGLVLVELKLWGDARGFFVERFHEGRFAEAGLPTSFAQDNHSRSAPGVLRGLHYQHTPAQGKLVGCIRGRIWDVAVDIRIGSATFGKHFATELTDTNGRLLWIPPGFAHGFCVLGTEPADVLYKVTHPYNPSGEGSIRWDDPELAVPWPLKELGTPTISARDQSAGPFGAYKAAPVVW